MPDICASGRYEPEKGGVLEPVREVLLDRDMRAPFALAPSSLFNRYYLRRAVSVANLIAIDAIAVLIGAVAGPILWEHVLGVTVNTPVPVAIAIALAVTVVTMASRGLYGPRLFRHRVLGIVNGAFAVLLALALIALLSGGLVRGPSLFLLWLTGTVAAVILRRWYDVAIAAALGRDLDEQRLLVIGSPAEGRRLCTAIAAADPGLRYSLAGTVEPGRLDEVDTAVAELWPSDLVVSDLEQVRPHMGPLVEVCRQRHIPLKIAVPSLTVEGESVSYLPGFAEPLFVVKDSRALHRDYVIKRICDVATALVLLLLLSPLLLVLAILVKLTSRGPVFFVSTRVGVGKRPFPCYKFRSMTLDAARRQADYEHLNDADGCLFKIAADPRLTSFGRTLRRTSLDELPQLFNVVRGEMSLVGPRPLPLRDVELMEGWHKRRHVVLPGITGLWQISGRNDLGFDDMIALDFRYIETWSLRGDAAILARTVGAVLKRRGAY